MYIIIIICALTVASFFVGKSCLVSISLLSVTNMFCINRSKPLKTSQAVEMIKIIKSKGKLAYDKLVEVLVTSETHLALGEKLKNGMNLESCEY